MSNNALKNLKSAMSPASNEDDISLTDTYFNEIGFKIGCSNSCLGSVESPPPLDENNSFLFGDDDDDDDDEQASLADASLGLGRDNNMAVDNVPRLGADKHPRPMKPETNGMSKSKAYNTPFHSYFFNVNNDEDKLEGQQQQQRSKKKKASRRPSGDGPNQVDIAIGNRHVDDDVSTLGADSWVAGIMNRFKRTKSDDDLSTLGDASLFTTSCKSPMMGAALQPPSIAHVRTSSTEKEEDDAEDGNGGGGGLPMTNAGTRIEIIGDLKSKLEEHKRKNGGMNDPHQGSRSWRLIHFVAAMACFLLAAAAVVLTLGYLKVFQSEEVDLPPAVTLPPWFEGNETSTDAPSNNTSNMKEEASSEQTLRKDLLQIILTLSPESFPSMTDENSAQWKAFDWVANDVTMSNQLSEDFFLDRVIQRWVLATLYHSTNGDNWSTSFSGRNLQMMDNNQNNTTTFVVETTHNDETDEAVTGGGAQWLSQDNECLWYSTDTLDVCDENGQIKAIHLDGVNLEGTLPVELGLLRATLERFYVPSNSITGTVPTEFGELTGLRRLQMTGNMLSGTIPTEMGLLTNLGVLGLGRNGFSSTVPSQMGRLQLLKTLGLEGNQLSGSVPTELANLTDLEFLSLDSNKLTGEVPEELASLEHLEVLSLHQNELVGSMPEGLCPSDTSSITVLAADCSEIECDCCTDCCSNCTDEEGLLVSMADPDLPAAPTEVNNTTEVISPTQSPTSVPTTSSPTGCLPMIETDRQCYSEGSGGINIIFDTCVGQEGDWVGVLEEGDYSEISAASQDIVKVLPIDTFLWSRACGGTTCTQTVERGYVALSGVEGMWEEEHWDTYVVALVRDDVVIAASSTMEIKEEC